MARFTVLLAALLLVSGSAIAQDASNTTTDAPDTTTDAPDTTTTTTTTTTPTTTTTTTEEPTTTTPDTTTPDTTTTSSTTTTPTTSPTTTPTTNPTTTPTPSTTPKPKPDSHIKYNVTENNVTCVMVAGEVYFNVNYTRTDNTTVISKVFIPSLGVTVDGSCTNATNGTQWISFTWGQNFAQMNFEHADKGNWAFTNVTASLSMDDDDNFVNATDAGKNLTIIVDYNFSPEEVNVNHSFICRSMLSTSNVTAMIDNDLYSAPITSDLKNIQIQAYNQIVNEKDFVDSVHCTADKTSDVVPIAVGCALAGLVVIVLIAYLVGRRRRSGAYQSV